MNGWMEAYRTLYDNLRAMQNEEQEYSKEYPSEYNNGRIDMISEAVAECCRWMPESEAGDFQRNKERGNEFAEVL